MKHLFTLFSLLVFSSPASAQWNENPSINNGISVGAWHQIEPSATSDNQGGAIVTWEDVRAGNKHIYAQRIDPNGNKKWAEQGVNICTMNVWFQHIHSVKLVSDGSNGAIIAWADERHHEWLNYYEANVYVQKVNSEGEVQWTTNGELICDADGLQQNFDIMEDGAGGVFIVWDDRRDKKSNIYAQYVDHSGEIQWLANGMPISKDNVDTNTLPKLVSDGTGGILIFWQQITANGERYFKAQRLSASGGQQWLDGGMRVSALSENDTLVAPEVVSDGMGGAVLCWYELSISGIHKIQTRRISSAGENIWTDAVSVYSGTKGKALPKIVSDNNGGAIIIWVHTPAPIAKVMWAQRINSSGEPQWQSNGVQVKNGSTELADYRLINDGADGAIITWVDYKDYDVYAQKLSGTGLVQWNHRGVVISNAPNFQGETVIIGNNNGDAILFWSDHRTGLSQIYGAITNNEILLPVTIKAFEAVTEQNQIKLLWTTTTEINNDRFNIERSRDGKKFEKIGEVSASSDFTAEKHYQFTDTDPLSGPNYYRLKQLDHDGKFTYSKMVAVKFLENDDFSIYPNPSCDRVNIKSSKILKKLEVVNMIGVTVMTIPIASNHLPVDISSLQPGLYVMKAGMRSKIFVKN